MLTLSVRDIRRVLSQNTEARSEISLDKLTPVQDPVPGSLIPDDLHVLPLLDDFLVLHVPLPPPGLLHGLPVGALQGPGSQVESLADISCSLDKSCRIWDKYSRSWQSSYFPREDPLGV